MRLPYRPSQWYLFVFIKESTNDFWVFSKGCYNRFAPLEDAFLFVRSQDMLPAEVEGVCAILSPLERKQLEQAAAAHAVSLKFYSSDQACAQQARTESHNQYIYGQDAPGGVLVVEVVPHEGQDD